MSEIEHQQEIPNTDNLKLLHDIYAVTHQILTQKCTFHAEEFEFVGKVVEFHKNQMLTIRKQIEELEGSAEVKVEDGETH